MSKKRKQSGNHIKGWEPFALTFPAPNEAAARLDPERYAQDMAEYASGKQTMWINNRYLVIKKEMDNGYTWLSIRHLDRKAIRDWRHFQRIKNELCGKEREGFELYPADSRLVDEANQYHLWVLPDGEQIPVGWNTRYVGDADAAAEIGAKQRPLEES